MFNISYYNSKYKESIMTETDNLKNDILDEVNTKLDGVGSEGWTLLVDGGSSISLSSIPECNELLIMGKAQSYYSFSQSLILPKSRFNAIASGTSGTAYLYLHSGEDNGKELELKLTSSYLAISSGYLYVYYR